MAVIIATHDSSGPSDPVGQMSVATYARVIPAAGDDVAGRTTEFPCRVAVDFDVTPEDLRAACLQSVLDEAAAQGWTVPLSDVIAVFSFTRG